MNEKVCLMFLATFFTMCPNFQKGLFKICIFKLYVNWIIYKVAHCAQVV